MAGNYKAFLKVNGNDIDLTGFPEEFVARTVAGAVSSLKKVEEIKELNLTMNYGKVKIFVNGNQVPIGPFPTLIFVNTLSGMVSTLKGVNDKVTSLELKMQAI
jgi:hypothetical protein